MLELPRASIVAAVCVKAIVTVAGIESTAEVRSAPGEPVLGAGGASVACKVSVAPAGAT